MINVGLYQSATLNNDERKVLPVLVLSVVTGVVVTVLPVHTEDIHKYHAVTKCSRSSQ